MGDWGDDFYRDKTLEMENIFKRLDYVIKSSEEITKHFDKKELEEVSMFSMCVLDRLNFSSESLKILLNQFSNNPKVDYGSGIIIRSVLLDYLIVLNALDIYGKNLEDTQQYYYELKTYTTMMLCDSVRNTMQYFETLEGDIPKNILSNMYNNLVSMNHNCFEEYAYDGSKPKIKTKEFKSPKDLFKTLVSSKELKRYKSIYEAYLFYSKYDHFGNMSYGLSRVNPLKQLSNLDKVIHAFPRSLMFVLVILNSLYPQDDFIINKLNETTLFIDEIEGIINES